MANPFFRGDPRSGAVIAGDVLAGFGGPEFLRQRREAQALGAMQETERAAAQTRGAAVTAVQDRMARGMSPQQAAADAFKAGDLGQAMADPDFVEQLQEIQTMLTVPAPEPFTATPGTTFGTRDPVTGQVTVQGAIPAAPPELPSRVREALFAVGNDPTKARQMIFEMFRAQTEGGQDLTAIERAAARLRARGVIDDNTHDMMIAGQLRVMPITEPGRFGEPTSNKFALVSPIPGVGVQVIEGAADRDRAPMLEPPPETGQTRPLAGFEDTELGDAVAFLGAGPDPMARSIIGSVARTVDPTRAVGLAESNWRQWLQNIRSDLEVLRARGRFSEPSIRRLEAMWPTAGIFTDARQAVNTGIQFRMMLEQGIASSTEDANTAVSRESYQAALERITGYQQLLRRMPQFSQMERLDEMLGTGEVGGLDIGGLAEETGAALTGVTERVRRTVPGGVPAEQMSEILARDLTADDAVSAEEIRSMSQEQRRALRKEAEKQLEAIGG